jgi:hypothetical protein
MKKLIHTTVGILFLAALLGSPAPEEESHHFKLQRPLSLCGMTLEPGEYGLVLHDNLADIYKGETLLLTTKAKVAPLGPHERPNMIYCCGDILMMVRLERLKVVFPEPLGKPVVRGARTQVLH